METPPLGRNILQRVGTPANTKQERKSRSESPSPERNMNMKQENPTFLVPPLWKDSLSLENIANDFLDSNVTGEVMKLDDFLKELQSSDVQEDMDDLCGVPGGQGMLQQPQMHDVRNQQDPHNRLYNLIRPANIDSLRESNSDHNQHQQLQGPHGHGQQQLPQHHQSSRQQLQQQQQQDLHGGGGSGGPVRPPIMHHVGKPPELYNNHNLQENNNSGIPQASVRPLVRQNMVSPESHMLQNDRLDRLDRLSPESKKSLASKRKERMRTTSEDSEDDSRSFSGYTSTVCVNFSQDDLRLATIPGQVQDFDPATRRFSEEELKPQPIIRKRKKQFVPDELKNNKYWAKRSKNNEAAKRSREARRLKENQIAMRARFLEEQNCSLKSEVENLKKENGDLKQMMVDLEKKFNQLVDKR